MKVKVYANRYFSLLILQGNPCLLYQSGISFNILKGYHKDISLVERSEKKIFSGNKIEKKVFLEKDKNL